MSKNIHEINIIIKGKEWEEALNKSFAKTVKETKLDGFRKGKVPRDMYEKKYGKESLFMNAVDFIVPEAYTKALQESKLLPIIQPNVNIKEIDDKHVEFTFTITTKPEVKIGKYKKLGIKKPEIKVTKDEIEKEIDNIKQRYAELVIKEEVIVKGDIAIIDFEGFKDNMAFDGGKGDNYSLEIGSNTFIPGFEESLIGKKANDEYKFDVTFPKDYANDDLKGQPVTFKIKIKEVKERIIPELNEDLFSDLGLEGVTNKKELEAVLTENIKVRKENDCENKYIDDLLKAAAKNTDVDIPPALIDEEINRMIEQYTEQLQMQGIKLEQYYQITNTTEEKLREQMTEEATNRVFYRFMLEEIANKEKIDVSDEEADNQATTMAQRYEVNKDEFLSMFGGLDMIKYDIKMRKAIEILKENN